MKQRATKVLVMDSVREGGGALEKMGIVEVSEWIVGAFEGKDKKGW